ncbi:MAG: UDP-2,3-diacylglucosamine diphosphatase LpxI [Verrucomicrobia bacterium]|nr:UDP-2,3-diacylglucosamine diphosphatase LpxI [Verrucomicrobiota bacterium]MBT5062771.1 UDP-2,3-diacylglucosamine diphosphatase LpxI [Verrucomicrobiota bacterium]MBT5477508.1 UDP-2,3-diacylglucosamine diphosphatase LpxI [Verrucomicrobiota bacterium]MBT6805563.1 UDP-2,3-diacylglucosamine diphosphatase LpxI [Verrucomicrobiota bacterium]MBT7535855.1 UDP-2,3-diacylglucosamine diphosphatase LpxI [Verrucomicrobiota bacterium]
MTQELFSSVPPTLGLIAGGLSLPLEMVQLLRSAGVRKLVVVAFEGETDPALEVMVDELVWLRVGQLSKMIRYFKSHGVGQCIMAGRIAPKNLFDIKPDLRAASLLFRLKEKNAHTIFGGIGDELKKDGIDLIEAVPWIQDIMPGEGFLMGSPLKARQLDDVAYGFKLAKEVSRLDIGQSVVVKNGTVLAVEGFEGTDDCLSRGGQLAGKNGEAIGVKVAKLDHDMRFDIPCIGLQTIENCIQHKFRALAFEPGKIILLEQESIEQRVRKESFALLSVPSR